ncbi:hypothetical protein CAPTEDRAFT_229076 [Capitella teleta]|uniref:ditrans,polycis-polyprenyl diphosphate synthase [(2E,6E)-farnesyldiphosphate specific] n=1 Tax=Capitella teleta TaxID=283909 RepID=X2B1C2_CAPTE|nr:hypothetical protein CAPTEDRAFT_229076 [Capitella teleta]|eukprot:ELU00317.1 hypothetical protein CAPTEDRAFT_229076 [Capitella teleta]
MLSTVSPAGVILRFIHAFIYANQLILNYAYYVFKFLTVPLDKTPRLCQDAKTGRSDPSIRKLPLHVGILIAEDEVSLSDVARIVVWCFASGISHISIYDRKGFCKLHEEALKSHMSNHLRKMYQSSSNKAVVEVHIQKNGLSSNLNNGHSSQNSLEVRLFSADDGRGSIVQAAKSIATAVAQHRVSAEHVIPQYLDSILQEKVGLPDPDLLLKFGEVQCLMGCLPWQIRLSEIISHATHHNLDYKSFYSLIQQFNNTKQRFGR